MFRVSLTRGASVHLQFLKCIKISNKVFLKFRVSNKIYCAELLKMLQIANGESFLSKAQAYKWYKALTDG